ncbi:hypothetical protein VCUG_01844 [Vavraia culicis subsp. floridensis]|uniref:Uncharacterized protein n=1 Tax=Vavraia culicis (isolate floridensis) TaxID=948595 RepID=L2GST1_VAVCU|nr:uncharacterized protein VCUG_01844 [Vavraia culicis subsp. floridensis]ELA46694.1 hypothetical protein VCUG_01844 [Vavraia culicis subsp. floridensis]
MIFLYIVVLLFNGTVIASSEDSKTNPEHLITTEAFRPLDLLTPDIESVIKMVVNNTSAVDEELKKRILVKLEEMNFETNKITDEEVVTIRSIMEKNKDTFYDNFINICTNLSQEPLLEKTWDLSLLAERIRSGVYTLVEQSHEQKLVRYSTLLLNRNSEIFELLKGVLEDFDRLGDTVLHFNPVNESDIKKISLNNEQLVENITKIVNTIANEFITSTMNNTSRKNKQMVETLVTYVVEQKQYILNRTATLVEELSTLENEGVVKTVAQGNLEIKHLITRNMDMLTDLIRKIITDLSDDALQKVKEMMNSVNKDFLQRILPGFQ